MKLTKDELLTVINDAEISDDLKIELMEDIDDSFVESEIDPSAMEALQNSVTEWEGKYNDLSKRYRDRFFEGKEFEEEKEEETEDDKIIDIKEI